MRLEATRGSTYTGFTWAGRLAAVSAASIFLALAAALPVTATASMISFDSVIQDSTRGDHQEGTTFSAIPVATFTDSSCSSPCSPSGYVANVFWGDSTPSTVGTLTLKPGTNGTFDITASHAFPDEFFSASGNPPFGFPINVHVTPTGQAAFTSPTGYVAVMDAARQAVAGTFSFTPVASVPFNGQIGVFSDGNLLAAPTDHVNGTVAPEYGLSIDWGDCGSPVGPCSGPGQPDTTSGLISIGACGPTNGPSGGPGCQVNISGSHTYQYGGSYSVQVTVSDGANLFTLPASASAVVNQIVTATVNSDSAPADHVEGVSYPLLPIASFSDTDACTSGCKSPGLFTATVNWGDGTTSSNTTIGSPVQSGNTGTYGVTAPHTYAQDGTYPIVVKVVDTSESPAISNIANGSLVVGEAPLEAKTAAILSAATSPFGGKIGGFHDDNQLASPNDNGSQEYSATVSWGDGTATTSGTVAFTGCGSSPGPSAGQGCDLSVTGSHTYANIGHFTITITVADGTSSSAVVITSSANIFAPRIGINQSGTGVPGVRGTNQSPVAGTRLRISHVLVVGIGSAASLTDVAVRTKGMESNVTFLTLGRLMAANWWGSMIGIPSNTAGAK